MIKLKVGRYYRFRDEDQSEPRRHVRVLYVGRNWASWAGCEGPKNIAVTAVFYGDLCAQVLEHCADTGAYRGIGHSGMDLVEDITKPVKDLIKREAATKAKWEAAA